MEKNEKKKQRGELWRLGLRSATKGTREKNTKGEETKGFGELGEERKTQRKSESLRGKQRREASVSMIGKEKRSQPPQQPSQLHPLPAHNLPHAINPKRPPACIRRCRCPPSTPSRAICCRDPPSSIAAAHSHSPSSPDQQVTNGLSRNQRRSCRPSPAPSLPLNPPPPADHFLSEKKTEEEKRKEDGQGFGRPESNGKRKRGKTGAARKTRKSNRGNRLELEEKGSPGRKLRTAGLNEKQRKREDFSEESQPRQETEEQRNTVAAHSHRHFTEPTIITGQFSSSRSTVSYWFFPL
nr:serine/arginine repetitive matrix protein 1-like [Coffea arabica]